MAINPSTPRSPSAANPALDLQVDENNPYAGLDRGLFMAMDLDVGSGDVQDRLCRIGNVSVQAYQAETNVAVVTYQVLYFVKTPVTESDYASQARVYVDPRNQASSFSFAALAKDYKAIFIEGLCINDFLQNKRATPPAQWENVLERMDSWALCAPVITPDEDKGLGVSHVRHHQYFSTTDGKPIVHDRSVMRYRGYELRPDDPTKPKSNWANWPAGRFIEFESPIFSHSKMVSLAVAHFGRSGWEEIKDLFEVIP